MTTNAVKNPAGARGPRFRGRAGKPAAAVLAALALAVGAYALHVQPGVERSPERDTADCGEAMGLLSTALLRWASDRGFDGEFPRSLDELAGSGLLPGGSVPECPLGGGFRYEAGLSPDMPLWTVLVWEDGPAHVLRGGRLVLHCTYVTARVCAMVETIGPDGEAEAGRRITARMEALIARQRGLLDTARLAIGGDAGAWKILEAAISGADSHAAAIAAWAALRAGRTDLRGSLEACAGAQGPGFGEPGCSAAFAVIGLGGRAPVMVLADGLSCPDYVARRRCFKALWREAGRDFGYAPYLPALDLLAAARRWREWAVGAPR